MFKKNSTVSLSKSFKYQFVIKQKKARHSSQFSQLSILPVYKNISVPTSKK